jgi:hypothetical protein
MPAALLRQLESEEVTCPAGELVRDADVRCHVVHESMSGHHNPETVERFCTADYTACPIWRAAKDAHWEDRGRAQREQLQREAAA